MDTARKETIPDAVRIAVWNKYCGVENGTAICLVGCGRPIAVSNFHCGHIVSEATGGKVTIQNLRPICAGCNSSIGKKNTLAFMRQYGFTKSKNWDGYCKENMIHHEISSQESLSNEGCDSQINSQNDLEQEKRQEVLLRATNQLKFRGFIIKLIFNANSEQKKILAGQLISTGIVSKQAFQLTFDPQHLSAFEEYILNELSLEEKLKIVQIVNDITDQHLFKEIELLASKIEITTPPKSITPPKSRVRQSDLCSMILESMQPNLKDHQVENLKTLLVEPLDKLPKTSVVQSESPLRHEGVPVCDLHKDEFIMSGKCYIIVRSDFSGEYRCQTVALSGKTICSRHSRSSTLDTRCHFVIDNQKRCIFSGHRNRVFKNEILQNCAL